MRGGLIFQPEGIFCIFSCSLSIDSKSWVISSCRAWSRSVRFLAFFLRTSPMDTSIAHSRCFLNLEYSPQTAPTRPVLWLTPAVNDSTALDMLFTAEPTVSKLRHILQNLQKLGFREIFLKAMACVSDCRDFQFCLSWQHTRTVFAFGMTDQNSGRGRPPRISHGRTTVLRPTQTTPSLKALTAFLCMKRGLQLKDQGNLDP